MLPQEGSLDIPVITRRREEFRKSVELQTRQQLQAEAQRQVRQATREAGRKASRQISRTRRETEQQTLDKAIKAFAGAVDDTSLVEKGFLTGNAAQMPSPASMPSGRRPGSSWSNQQTVSSSLIQRVTQNLGASFGRAPEDLELALAEQGLSWGPPFPPGRPLDPFFGYRRPARTWDYTVGENVQLTPRANRISFETIKSIYEAYDVAQICVRHLINDVRSLDYNWEPLPGEQADVSGDIEQAKAFFDSPDKRQPFRAWLAEYLQDVLRYDAGALYCRRNEAGEPIAWEVVSGPTILPLVDFYGRRPEDEQDAHEDPDGLFGGEVVPAYVQIIEGLPWNWLAADDLTYQPLNPLPDSQYGWAPLEAVLLSANTDIRFQWHFLQFFTSGSLPAGFMEAPPDQSDPAQIEHWQEVWDAVLLNDQSKLNQIRWVPNGSKFTDAKPGANTFNSEFPLYLMRRTCAAHGVTPNDLGFTESVNRATGDTQVDVQFRVGTSPLLRHCEDVIGLFTRQQLKLRCRMRFDDGQETDDRVATATAAKIDIEAGVLAIDERRKERGLPIDKSKPSPRYINNTRSGPIPLLALESIAGEVDPETYGPAQGQKLVDTPFAPPPGAIPPMGSPEALQAAATTGQAARELRTATTGHEGEATPAAGDEGGEAGEGEAAKTLDWRAVLDLIDRHEAMLKAGNTGGPGVNGGVPATTITGGTDGIVVRTGIQGSPLDDDDDEEAEDETGAIKQQQIALSLRRWRENSRNRLRKGRPPRRFVDPLLPQALHDEIWAVLGKAGTREEVDRAFAEAGKKAPAGSRPAFHSQADRIIAHYTPQITAALQATLPGLDEAVRAAYATAAEHAEAEGTVNKAGIARKALPDDIAAARAAAVEILGKGAKPSELKSVLTMLYGDSFLQGTHDAAQAAGGKIAASLQGVTGWPGDYWDAWKPGYGQAASQAADGGMRALLGRADITIQGLTDTSIDQIGNTIADGLRKGDSYEVTSKAVREAVGDPKRAGMIADTEYARATTTASLETYQQNGVEKLEWMAEGDACPECEENAAASPIAIGDDWPNGDVPVHPWCRCAIAPVIDLGGA
jgi:SPP1 gp7 family putative phage head morphogenesis protein